MSQKQERRGDIFTFLRFKSRVTTRKSPLIFALG